MRNVCHLALLGDHRVAYARHANKLRSLLFSLSFSLCVSSLPSFVERSRAVLVRDRGAKASSFALMRSPSRKTRSSERTTLAVIFRLREK